MILYSRTTDKVLIYILLGFAMMASGCGGGEEDPEIPDNLQPLLSFGHEGEVLLRSPGAIATDEQSAVYIMEQKFNRIYKFNLDGNFLSEVGKEGRGPAEYMYPSAVETDRNWLYVLDEGSLRLVLFGLDEDSTRVIKLERSFYEFKVYRDNIYGFSPGSFSVLSSSMDEGLISIYDKEGNRIDSFGEYLTLVENLPAGMNWPFMAVEDGVIHIVFKHFPLYRAYSTKGELLVEQDLSGTLRTLDETERNLDESTYKPDEMGRMKTAGAFSSMDVHGNKLFVSRHTRTSVIDEYLIHDDNSLIYQTTYSVNSHSGSMLIRDFFYHEPGHSFYILENNEVPKVTVYQIIDP